MTDKIVLTPNLAVVQAPSLRIEREPKQPDPKPEPDKVTVTTTVEKPPAEPKE